MVELNAPRESSVRKLFALSSNRCAFPECQTAIVDRRTGTILGEVCHIRAQKEGGPRFSPGQTSEERHSLQNLVLMCGVHHKIIDSDENVSVYTVERLLEIKAQHEASASAGEPDSALTTEAIAALLETVRFSAAQTTHMDFRGAFFNAGGYGGGPGGAGGGGGIIHIVGITPAGFREKVNIDGKPGRFPGGGGGGGGATVFSGRLVSDEDLRQGLHVSAFFFANTIEISNDLLYVLGAGWENCTLASVPQDVRINVAVVVESGTILPSTLLALAIVVEDPAGGVATSDSFDFGVAEVMRPIMRQSFCRSVGFQVTQAGLWSFAIRSGDVNLARTLLEFRVNDTPTRLPR
jgi:hypothetical protein